MILNDLGSSVDPTVDERLFRLLVASVKDYAIFLIDPNGYILSWNEGAENIKGYRAQEVIGKHISIFYLKSDIEKKQLRKNLNEALKHGMTESEGWRVKKDGTIFWAHMVLTTLYNDQGHLIGFAKVTRDITERKENEDRKAQINVELEKRVKENTEKIIANELRFRKLIENSYEGISLFDKNLRVIYRSPSSERINGWPYDERADNGALDLVHPDDLPYIKTRFAELLQKPAENFVVTCRALHQQGHYIWLECIFSNMLHDENIKAIVCNFRNVTEQKNAQLEREKITADLMQRNKDLEQFAYIVSHNLRMPVANITGLSNLLHDADHTDHDKERILKALSTSVQNLDKVILDLNHILQVNNDLNEAKETVSLPLLVKQIRQSIDAKQVIIKCDFKPVNKLITIKSYLHSIFQNLIVNSIKFKRAGIDPMININSSVVDGHAIIIFKDNGKGIDLHKHGEHIFGIYKRFDQSVEGKGLGLFMVKMQVERLGGTITVQSQLNVGTEYTIKLPLTFKQ